MTDTAEPAGPGDIDWDAEDEVLEDEISEFRLVPLVAPEHEPFQMWMVERMIGKISPDEKWAVTNAALLTPRNIILEIRPVVKIEPPAPDFVPGEWVSE